MSGGRCVASVVAHHELGERVLLELGEEVQAGGARQVVEAVAVLQLLHLRLEDEVERRAEQAAERHLLLGQAADPEVDVVEAGLTVGPGARAVEEAAVAGLGRRRRAPAAAARLAATRRRAGDRRVRAVGRDEVDQRLRVPDAEPEVDPALVRLQRRVAGLLVELPPRGVQRRDAGVAAAGDVDRREVERQAEQVVAQGVGDELVDLVADLARSCRATIAPAACARRERAGAAAVVELERVEERLDQPDVVVGAVGVRARDGLGQHRVAEAVDRVRELGDDRRVDVARRSRAKTLTCGWTLRANSSKTRCWYSISVTKRAAWKRRSPLHSPLGQLPVGAARRVARLLDAASLISSTRRLCSAWKTWWTAVRPMFSLPRPSPVMKCASSSSSS